MNILVTGGAGFIGSNLVRTLLTRTPHHVLNIDKLTYAGNLQSLADFADNNRYRFARLDITDSAAMVHALEDFQPDGIMHLAAESHVDRSIDGPGDFINTNILGTYTLLQAARGYLNGLTGEKRERFRFVHVSTDEVFGSLSLDDPGFCETTPYDPHSPYSASKAASDHLARAWHDTYGLPVVVTNCSNNYGPCQFPEKLIPVVILNALHGRAIPVYGKGENIRDWLYVVDHARALQQVLEGGAAGETYNIGGNNELRNLDLVRTLCALLDELIPPGDNPWLSAEEPPSISSYAELITFVADRPGHDLRYAIDSRKIRRELGWEPVERADTGFRKTVQWYLDNADWWQNILSGDYRLERLGLG